MDAQKNNIAPQDSDGLYSAAQLAAALKISKRNALKALAGVEPSGNVPIHGNATPAWTVDTLPERLREAVTAHASKIRLSIADYLDTVCKRWEPKTSLAQISDSCLALAHKLKAALLPALQRMNSATLGPADRVRLGLADYRSAFGHAITERHWQRLMDRTLRRDGGAENFERLEIYLPEKPACKADAKRLLPGESDFKPLKDLIQSFAVPNAPTRTEIAAFWAEAFELYQAGADTNREQRALRRELVKFLFRHAPWLAKSSHALRVAFDRKFAKWVEKDESAAALLDGREQKRGEKRAPEIPQSDKDIFEGHAAFYCGGRRRQAARELREMGSESGLSDYSIQVLNRPSKSKSYLNRRLENSIRPGIKMVKPYILGRKAIDDATAHLDRDYSKLASMSVIQADDFTFPVYFCVPDGNGWFNLTRGQCLLFVDVRSWKVIAWSLQPERNYNSLVIRTLMNRVCTGWGLPGNWYFEGGMWQKAHVVKNTVPAGWKIAYSLPELKTGWASLEIGFRKATRARTKIVERIGGLMQDMMPGVRGYCGRDERRDCPDATKRAMDEVQFRRVNHPGELFLSFDAWHDQLDQLIHRYNAASQDGKVLQGLSPDEALEKFWPHGNPPARPDANWWHLVAHYVRPVPVTTNGICFRVGSKSFVYRNERTGQDRGKTVLANFDPETPEFLCVTDMNRKNPYLVERSTPVDFLAAPGDPVFEREIAKAASHSAYPRARYNVLKARFAPTFRRNLVDVETAETGQEFQRLRQDKLAEQKQVAAVTSRARKSFNRLGMAMPQRLRPEQADAARELSELLQKDEETPAAFPAKSLAQKDGQFTYHLKPSGDDRIEYVDFLITRLTEFRKAGKSFGQHFSGAISFGVTRKITQSQIGGDIYAPENFEAVCAQLKEKIDATVLGKRNAAKGAPNYHEFAEAQETL